MDEFERIEKLRAAFATSAAHVRLGIGDDAAVVRFDSDAVISTDASIEGVHFRRSFGSLEAIARRAFHAAASDLAAMGARASCAFSSLTLPQDLPESDFDALIRGLAGAARELALPIVGGNLAAASEIGITTMVVGTSGGVVLARRGAVPGDGVYLTGPVGGAGLGLAALLAGEAPSDVTRRWFDVRARLDVVPVLREVASACIDLSDGLAADLGHLLDASGVGAQLDLRALPTFDRFDADCASRGLDPRSLALFGGEDYELCFTSRDDARARTIGARIGTVTGSLGLVGRDGDDEQPIERRGHRHFT